jgi:hypothetical protein
VDGAGGFEPEGAEDIGDCFMRFNQDKIDEIMRLLVHRDDVVGVVLRK